MTRPAKSGGKLALFEVLNNSRDAAAPSPAAAKPQPERQPTRQSVTGDDGSSFPFGKALLATTAVAAIVGAAFFVGRMSAASDNTAVAASGDVRPDVLDVDPIANVDDRLLPTARLAGGSTVVATSPVTLGPRGTPGAAATVATAPPAVTPADVERIDGLNYLLIQSYHPSERDRADATAAALIDAGIGATVETKIRGWGNYWCVVGTESFKRRTRNPDLDAYKNRVMAVGRDASKSRLIKAFDPQLVQWGR